MAGQFRRPGSVNTSTFGFEFSLDRDGSAAHPPPPPPPPDRHHRRLPILAHREEFLSLVEDHQVVLVYGEPGCGKSTQLPQFLRRAGWTQGGYQVALTQPQRVAAGVVAERLAAECGAALGGAVGFCAPFQDVTTPGSTELKVVTDGCLLREVLGNPLLSAYSAVIVDDVQQRSASTDVLLGLLRKILRKRTDLKLVLVTSSAHDLPKMQAFFKPHAQASGSRSTQVAVLAVRGAEHMVQKHYLSAPATDYVSAATEAVLAIHRAEVPGDVLVFLTSKSEAHECVSALQQGSNTMAMRHVQDRLKPVALFVGMPASDQAALLRPSPRGTRRVVVATSVAETAVTMEGVVYVVDCMFAKVAGYNPIVNLDCLLAAPISKAAAAQRAGRAGRLRPGHCFRLCTQSAFEALDESSVPELQRTQLAGTLLLLKAAGIDNVMTYAWVSPPPAEAVVRALEQLYALGAINEDAKLTQDIGAKMAELPLPPQLAVAVLRAGALGCSSEVATLAAILCVTSVWYGAPRSKALRSCKLRFAVAEGDLLTYLNVWHAWEEHGRSPKWAHRNSLNHKALLRAADIRVQILALLHQLRVPVATCEGDMAKVHTALTAGLFQSACRFHSTEYDRLKANDAGTHIYVPVQRAQAGRVRLAIDATSVLHGCKPEWLLFASCQQVEEGLWRMADLVATDAAALQAAAPHFFQRVRN